jgi:hypothetical protein
MPISLSPTERTLRAQMAAHALHSKYSGGEITAAARAASPGSDGYWLRRVDPDNVLEPAERQRRAGHAKKQHFLGLALKSATARRKRGAK